MRTWRSIAAVAVVGACAHPPPAPPIARRPEPAPARANATTRPARPDARAPKPTRPCASAATKLAPPTAADDRSRAYACDALAFRLRAELFEDEDAVIPLSARPHLTSGDSGATCWVDGESPVNPANRACQKIFSRLRKALLHPHSKAPTIPNNGLELGHIDGHRAAVWSGGPHGSGHYWDLLIAVVVHGRVRGAYTTTSTAGWRNLGGSKQLGAWPFWRTLFRDHYVEWHTLDIPGQGLGGALLYPLAYRLKGTELVVDRKATLAELARFARAYAKTAAAEPAGRPARAMHRGAGAAYAAVANDAACPVAGTP